MPFSSTDGVQRHVDGGKTANKPKIYYTITNMDIFFSIKGRPIGAPASFFLILFMFQRLNQQSKAVTICDRFVLFRPILNKLFIMISLVLKILINIIA